MFTALVALALTLPPPATPPVTLAPSVTFTAADGRVEVAATIPQWLGITATAAKAKVSNGWLVLIGTAREPVELRVPDHPNGKRLYLARRIDIRLCDGALMCPLGIPTVRPLK